PLVIDRKGGQESLHYDGNQLPANLLAFWQWSASDLVSNVTRGRLAEFIVATALGVDVWGGVRNEWDAIDLLTPEGFKVEVKSAAHVQSWFQSRLSKIVWRIPPARAWDAATNLQSSEVRRQADVYVLALLRHEDKLTIDPLNVQQWCFFVVPTSVLDARARSQNCISLESVRPLAEPVTYYGLRQAVARAGKLQRDSLGR